MSLTRILLGRPLATAESDDQRIGPYFGVSVLGLDALASAAYGPEAMLTVLLPLGASAPEYSLPLATFLIAPWLLHQGQHVALDVVVAALPPAWARALDRLGNTIGLAVSLVFVVFGARTIAASAAQGSMVIKAIVFPEWWLYAPVPVCFALLAVEFARRLAGRGAPARPPG